MVGARKSRRHSRRLELAARTTSCGRCRRNVGWLFLCGEKFFKVGSIKDESAADFEVRHPPRARVYPERVRGDPYKFSSFLEIHGLFHRRLLPNEIGLSDRKTIIV